MLPYFDIPPEPNDDEEGLPGYVMFAIIVVVVLFLLMLGYIVSVT